MSPREIVKRLEADPVLPGGGGERFAGYSVIGLPFCSGHVLALRRFPGSSVGPGFTSVWHREPSGEWTFYSTVNPDLGCSRYFGGEVKRNVVGPIQIEWTGPARFRVEAAEVVRWDVTLSESVATRVMNAAARLMPESWTRSERVLGAMGAAGGAMLGAGGMSLAGLTPNGQRFLASPRQVWLVGSSYATLRGRDLGPVGALTRQARLRDFLIPQRGLFAVAQAVLQPAG